MLPYLLTGVLKNILSPDSSGAQLKINAPLYHSDVVDLGGAWESNHKELVKLWHILKSPQHILINSEVKETTWEIIHST